MVVVVSDQVTAGIAPASQIAHLVPGVEDELLRFVAGSSQVTGVKVVPQAKVALLANQVCGFR